MNMEKLSLTLVVLLAACDAKPGANIPPPTDDPMFRDHWTQADPDDRGPGSLDPAVAATEGKVARRVSVEELRRSIPAIFDGITWTVPVNRNEAPGFDQLSRTLGEADYIQTTVNNIDATPLFFKFMDDMAGDVCQKAIARDAETNSPSNRILMREADADANLRYLRLKLHGIHVPTNSMEGLSELRALYEDIVAETGNESDGWYGVCVVMVTSPEFMAY
jgi:hypothetical protein